MATDLKDEGKQPDTFKRKSANLESQIQQKHLKSEAKIKWLEETAVITLLRHVEVLWTRVRWYHIEISNCSNKFEALEMVYVWENMTD